ncbi:MAG: hypothetical protein VYE68_12055 [Acidobacteriota bacterium]|nr:hypothetical protein [Acidobacteriota bacterium]
MGREEQPTGNLEEHEGIDTMDDLQERVRRLEGSLKIGVAVAAGAGMQRDVCDGRLELVGDHRVVEKCEE